MNILINGLTGAGNFGDDFISVCLCKRILSKYPEVESITILHFPYLRRSDYPDHPSMKFVQLPWVKRPGSYLKDLLDYNKAVAKAEVILIGGGGLIQDSHGYFTPWEFCEPVLKLLGQFKAAHYVAGGIGPVRYKHNKDNLNLLLNRFDSIQVRDEYSARFVEDKDKVFIAPDIIAGEEEYFQGLHSGGDGNDYLGCSIRPWKGLETERVVRLISEKAKSLNLSVKLFVFEHHEYSEEEYLEAVEIKSELSKAGVKSEIIDYAELSVEQFIQEMCAVNCAIASRFHANIVWQKLGVKCIPVAYAPKVKSLYEDLSAKAYSIEEINLGSEVDLDFQEINLGVGYTLPDLNARSKRKVSYSITLYAMHLWFKLNGLGRKVLNKFSNA